MIFKKSKILTDNIVDPVSGESLRGHFQATLLSCLFLFYGVRGANDFPCLLLIWLAAIYKFNRVKFENHPIFIAKTF